MKMTTPKQPSTELPHVKQSGVRRSLLPSPLSTGTPLLQRQCACGGGCPRCQENGGIQTKLKISEPGDPYEQEADRIADEVMRMPEPSVQRQKEPEEQEEENEEDGEEGTVQRLVSSQTTTTSSEAPPIVHTVLQSPGQPLDPETRIFMESRFGHDFSQVRVHTDSQANKSAKSISARVYTVGQNIAFGFGEYTPDTTSGRQLLAHELTHTIQQKNCHHVQRRSGEDTDPSSAHGLYEAYQNDLPALGKELYRLIVESANNVSLVLQVLDEVAWIDRDDVAHYFIQASSEEELSTIAREPVIRALVF